MKANKVIDEILARKSVKAICKVCGSIQHHTDTHCSGCGTKYVLRPETFLEAMKICHNRDLQDDKVNSHALSPGYQAAIWKRILVSAGISRSEFIEYVLEKLNE